MAGIAQHLAERVVLIRTTHSEISLLSQNL